MNDLLRFLGGSADVGAFKNCFGDANCFVRRDSFDAIGGYTEDHGVGFEDWEMYANASLRGFKVSQSASQSGSQAVRQSVS